MSFLSILSISIGAILVENIVFSSLLGVKPFLRESKSTTEALKSGIAIALLLTVAAIFAFVADWAIIRPLGLGYMRTVIFVLVMCGAVIAGEKIIRAKASDKYKKLAISLPLVTTNAATLGIMLIVAERQYNIIEAVVSGISAGIGYLMAVTLFAAVRERLEYSDVPKWLEDLPIAFITAGLIALAFSGFSGMKFM